MVQIRIADIVKMGIVHGEIINSGLIDWTGQVRFPDPLCQPHPARLHSKQLLQPVCQQADLANLILIRDRRENRLVIGSPENLHPVTVDKPFQAPDKIRSFFNQPVQKTAGVMQRYPDAGKALQNRNERLVSLQITSLENLIQVPYRLMIVQRKDKVDLPAMIVHNRLFLSPE